MAETFDLIVRGGEVANHAGRGMADVGVRAGKVAAIGDLGQASAGEIFDAVPGHAVHSGETAAAKSVRIDPRAALGVRGAAGSQIENQICGDRGE